MTQGIGVPRQTGRVLSQSGDYQTTFHWDDGEGCYIIANHQDCGGIIERNLVAQTSGHDGYTPSREAREVAEIHFAVLDVWMREGLDMTNLGSPEMQALLRKKLNDSDWRKVRSHLGSV